VPISARMKAWMLPDPLLELAERGDLTTEATDGILDMIGARYRMEAIEHSLVRLQEMVVEFVVTGA